MNKILNGQRFLNEDAKAIVDKSLEMLGDKSDDEELDTIVSDQIREYYFSIDSYDQESGLIDVLKRIAIQYVALLRHKQAA
ncbi:MAG: hypothetical protein K8F25_09050 [Fimbriimonadaceae bacterium]|nr:hypothetical protein [Alphaproteobacteria bacterium]